MKHKNTCIERRKHPRISKRLQFKLNAEDFDVLAETINLCSLGAYCQVNKYISPMTNVKIALALPYGDQENEFEYVECNGVVVRVEDTSSEGKLCSVYNLAIFFNEIEESEKEKIASFMKS